MNDIFEHEYQPNYPENQSNEQYSQRRINFSFLARRSVFFFKPETAKVYGHIIKLTELGRRQIKLSSLIVAFIGLKYNVE